MSKKRNKGRIFIARMGQAPTSERRRQNGGVFAEIIDRDARGRILMRRYKAVWECPLDAYLDHGAISPAEHQAGLKFRRAYFSAVLCKRAAYERKGCNTPFIIIRPTSSERTLREAYRAVSTYSIGAIIDICGLDQPAKDREKLERLRKGLGQLSALWGMAGAEVCGRR